jgi:hypothetical protein
MKKDKIGLLLIIILMIAVPVIAIVIPSIFFVYKCNLWKEVCLIFVVPIGLWLWIYYIVYFAQKYEDEKKKKIEDYHS